MFQRTIKRTFTSVLACMLALIMAFTFGACGDPVEPTTVTLSETAITIGVGDSKILKAEVSDDSDVEWTTSDENVATVSALGVVKGVTAGSVTVTATANGVSATCAVTVENIIVELDKTTLTLDKEDESNKTATLVATVKNGDTVIDETVAWTSSDSSVATVENGVVTAVSEGTATITAKRANGNAKATCEVSVIWASKPTGYATIGFSEQNKAVTNTYGYWNDQGWEFGSSTMYDAYYADSANSQAGKATFDFEVTSRIEGKKTAPTIQVSYRSSKGQEGGMLEVGYFYTLDLDIVSSVAGEISVNDYAVNSEIEELKDEVYIFTLEANKLTHVQVKFAHYDDGRIHDTTDYSNVESALHLLLGSLEGRVQVTIDNLVWTKGEVAPERPETGSGSGQAPATQLPDLSKVDAIALDIDAENAKAGEGNCGNEKYDITDNDNGKSYTIAYSGTYNSTYSHIIVQIPEEANAANCNTFSVKIKNNGEAAMTIRFDLAGAAYDNGTNPASRDVALSAVATVGAPSVSLDWDGVALTVDAGVETVLYITYETDSEAGAPYELLVYFDTVWGADTTTEHTGNVTVSEFKFANVVEEEKDNAAGVVGTPVALKLSTENSVIVNNGDGAYVGTYDITTTDDGYSYNVDYKTYSSSYENLVVDITGTNVATSDRFSVTITNNGDSAIEIRFNINGKTATQDGNGNDLFDCATSSYTDKSDANHTDLTYGGTTLTVAAGETVTLVIVYDNNGAHGVPTELCIYFNTNWYGNAESNWAEIFEERSGDVTLSNFVFGNAQ